MMFGIGTDRTRLHADNFTNLLGMDEHSWGLSHKGVIWHKGAGIRYTKCFKENLATTIGVLFDGIDGTLTYYKDGICLGVAFCELDQVGVEYARNRARKTFKEITALIQITLIRCRNLSIRSSRRRRPKPKWCWAQCGANSSVCRIAVGRRFASAFGTPAIWSG